MSDQAPPESGPLTCVVCAERDGVAPVTFSQGGRDVTRPLCPQCKSVVLERRRVRTGRTRRGPSALARTGYLLIALSVLALLVVIATSIVSALTDDGAEPRRCRAGEAGTICDR